MFGNPIIQQRGGIDRGSLRRLLQDCKIDVTDQGRKGRKSVMCRIRSLLSKQPSQRACWLRNLATARERAGAERIVRSE